ncbi:MAG: hypothetical protein KDA81_02370 [Planctomycetaceae bacterium]|nr:hypothetical protein [Planctomycetaceae bacterium]
MQTRIWMLLLSGAIGLATTGCSVTSPTMRGQSPGGAFASYEDGYGDSYSGSGACNGGYCDPGMGCPPGGSCQPGMPCHSCGPQCGPCLNLPFHPVHRNFHTYDVPKNLTYPQQNTPAAVYQYPYYTTRGPTDFFMK